MLTFYSGHGDAIVGAAGVLGMLGCVVISISTVGVRRRIDRFFWLHVVRPCIDALERFADAQEQSILHPLPGPLDAVEHARRWRQIENARPTFEGTGKVARCK
jgi:hypothetical protein